MSEFEYPRVGVGVWIRKNGKVLVGLRKQKSKMGADTWAPPGGKLDLFESWEECAHREAREETGLEIKNVAFMTATNEIYPDAKQHYVTLHVVADWDNGEPQEPEPEKHGSWGWYEWSELPQPLLQSAGNFVNTGYNPFNF